MLLPDCLSVRMLYSTVQLIDTNHIALFFLARFKVAVRIGAIRDRYVTGSTTRSTCVFIEAFSHSRLPLYVVYVGTYGDDT